MLTQWPSESLWESLVPHWPGFTVEVLPEIDSSNSELMRRARAGRCEPTLLVAEHQTAGRGRLGRPWVTDRVPGGGAQGPALMFSVGVSLAPQDWSGLSLAVGLSVAQSLQPAMGPQIGLKWPNDLWVNDHKLAGILIETATAGQGRFAVIGIGINIAAPQATGLSTPAAGLASLQPGQTAAQALWQVVLPLMATLRRFEAEGWAPFRAGFDARDVLRGREVRVLDPTSGHEQVGQALGVGDDGGLRVQLPTGVISVTSGEVSVRPVSGRAG